MSEQLLKELHRYNVDPKELRSSNPMSIAQGLRRAAQCVYLAAPEEVARDLSERLLGAANEIDRLTATVERDKTSATHRLHNLCDALSEDAAESPFSREAWELADQAAAETGNENLRLKAEIELLRAALTELLGEMALDFQLHSYDVYQVTKGAVESARAILARPAVETFGCCGACGRQHPKGAEGMAVCDCGEPI